MSLNRLARNAVLLTALASAIPSAGCDKTEQGVQDGQSSQAASAPLEPGEKEFPECGKGMKTTNNGNFISGPWGSTEENFDCVFDHSHDLNCSAIREERRRRIAEIPSLFKCVNGEIKIKAQPSQLADLGDFSRAEARTKVDCKETSRESRVRIGRVLDRMACDEEGKPHEKLGWGDTEGGRIYNPCAGGKC